MAENAITVRIRQQLVQLEVTLIGCLAAECERGQMTPEQFRWAVAFFTTLDQYDEPEAAAQLDAWATWRDETHPGWDKSRLPSTAKGGGTCEREVS